MHDREGIHMTDRLESTNEFLFRRLNKLEAELSITKNQLIECRKHLAASMCKECKCDNNIAVNEVILENNAKLRETIKKQQ